MRYEFHPQALKEYDAAALWYADREPALALRFIDAVEDAIGRILDALQSRTWLLEAAPPKPHTR